MSVRGIEIHNGYLDFPDGMPQTLHMGTEASPLTQGVADQIVLSAVINAVALGGLVEAGRFDVIGSVTATADLIGLYAGTVVNDGITITGFTYGIHVKQVMLGDGVISETWDGIRIEMQMAAGAELGQAYGIFISNFMSGTVGQYCFIRMQENSTATINWALYVRAGPGGCNYFAILHGAPGGWAAEGYPSVQRGWIKMDVGGETRYIRLYSTL